LKVLIVDDEPVARRVLCDELELLPGTEIVGESENGVDALLKIASLKPDLVFLDLQMPLMTGLEVLRRLAGSLVPLVIVVTAYTQHATEARNSGAAGYLLKPVEATRLRDAVENAQRMIQAGVPG
jgi:DNA-binding LytR/AlgR family response regulator